MLKNGVFGDKVSRTEFPLLRPFLWLNTPLWKNIIANNEWRHPNRFVQNCASIICCVESKNITTQLLWNISSVSYADWMPNWIDIYPIILQMNVAIRRTRRDDCQDHTTPLLIGIRPSWVTCRGGCYGGCGRVECVNYVVLLEPVKLPLSSVSIAPVFTARQHSLLCRALY